VFGYWLLIGVPIVLSFIDWPKKNLNPSLVMLGVFYVLFVGLRYEVGSDRWAYANMYDNFASSSFKEVLEMPELAFGIINWLVGQLDAGVYLVNFIVAIIFVSGLVRFAKTTPLPFLALISVTPYLVIAIGMSATRQSAAIGLVFHLMASWRQGLAYKVSLSTLATLFHNSGIMSFIFVMQSLKMRHWVRLLLYGLGAAVLYPVLTQTDAALKYQKIYIEDDLVSSGALMHALLNVIPSAIYLVFRRQWRARFGASDLLLLLALLSILSVFGVSVSSTGLDRLALYLSPIQMMVYGSLPFLFGYQYKTQLTVVIIVIQLLIMFFWLSYANTAEPFLPYQNLITDALFG
jgi:hypothetical protein